MQIEQSQTPYADVQEVSCAYHSETVEEQIKGKLAEQGYEFITKVHDEVNNNWRLRFGKKS